MIYSIHGGGWYMAMYSIEDIQRIITPIAQQHGGSKCISLWVLFERNCFVYQWCRPQNREREELSFSIVRISFGGWGCLETSGRSGNKWIIWPYFSGYDQRWGGVALSKLVTGSFFRKLMLTVSGLQIIWHVIIMSFLHLNRIICSKMHVVCHCTDRRTGVSAVWWD